jgi:hypothetical protein
MKMLHDSNVHGCPPDSYLVGCPPDSYLVGCWQVAKDYLEYMIHGPFRAGTSGGAHCGGIVQDPTDCRFITTETGIELASKSS